MLILYIYRISYIGYMGTLNRRHDAPQPMPDALSKSEESERCSRERKREREKQVEQVWCAERRQEKKIHNNNNNEITIIILLFFVLKKYSKPAAIKENKYQKLKASVPDTEIPYTLEALPVRK